MRLLRDLRDTAAIEAVPLEERYDESSTYQLLLRAAAQWPTRPALSFVPTGARDDAMTSWTFEELAIRVTQTANLLDDLGVGSTDCVSMMLPNLLESHQVLWGAQAAGMINPLNPALSVDQLSRIVSAAKSRVLVAPGPSIDPAGWDKAVQVYRQVDAVETLVKVGQGPSDLAGVVELEASAAYDGARLRSGRRFARTDPAGYFHTGGTTGHPKLARHSHGNELYMAWALAETIGHRAGDTLMCGLPMFHVNAVFVTGLSGFRVGAQTVLMSPTGFRNAVVQNNFWALVERFRGTFFSAVPTVLIALMNVPHEGYDLASLRSALVGAAPCPEAVFNEFQRRTGTKLLDGYGLTEGTCGSAITPRDGEARVGSVGIRFPYQDVRVVRIENDEIHECADNEPGKIAIRGPNVFDGYLDEAHNQGIWLEPGLFDTGDLGRRDRDGYVWLSGRAKDVIIRSGHNIDPRAIEEIAHQHPNVVAAAAVGAPDPSAGEVPVLFVTLADPSAGAGDCLEFVRARVGDPTARPTRLFVVDALPVSAVGKLFKPELRDQAAEHTLTALLAPIDARVSVSVATTETGTTALVRLPQDAEGETVAVIRRVLGQFTFACVVELSR